MWSTLPLRTVLSLCHKLLVSQSLGGLSEEELSQLQQEATFLQQFWVELHQNVKATPSGSMLRDMAQLDVEVTQVGVPDNSEEKVWSLYEEAEFFSCMITLHGCGNVQKIFNAVSFPTSLPKECTILPLLSYAGIKPPKPQWLAYQENRFPLLLPVEQSTFCCMHGGCIVSSGLSSDCWLYRRCVLCLCIDSRQQFTLATLQNLLGSSTCDINERGSTIWCVLCGFWAKRFSDLTCQWDFGWHANHYIVLHITKVALMIRYQLYQPKILVLPIGNDVSH